jgi:hypothetical protein
MSLTAFKRKSVIQYGSNRSGKPPGGYWLPQGPFGHATTSLENAIENYGPVGFSLNGGTRNVGYVGKDSKMSRNGTPFRGKYPYGNGGTFGAYPTSEPVYNVNRVIALGDQYMYVKPSVLSTRGMLEKKYRWAYNGQYPNFWVQPLYTGNQTQTASQSTRLTTLSAANVCDLRVNNPDRYEGYIVNHGPTLCRTSTARFKYNDMTRNGPYTKVLQQPVPSSDYTLYIQRKCANPSPAQKPFPYAVTTGSGHHAAGTSITSFGNACNMEPIFLAPPKWYISAGNNGLSQ